MCVLLRAHIYYVTALSSCGSEAVDQDNDGDSKKTRQEGLSGGGGGSCRMTGGVCVVTVDFVCL